MRNKAKSYWYDPSMCESPGKKSETACGQDYMDYGKMQGEMHKEEATVKMPECVLLAHSYVPWQIYENAFCPTEALMKGTLFPELWGVYPIPR